MLMVLFSVLLYSRFIGTKGLKINEKIISSDITESYDGLKIVHFSDLHYKKVITEKRVKYLVDSINKMKPDIVLFTGDLLDKAYQLENSDINFLIQEFSRIETKYGAYAVLGDQDYPEEEIRNIYIQSNFTILENNYTVIYNEDNNKILIGGLASSLDKKINIEQLANEISMARENTEFAYQIVILHEPDNIPKVIDSIENTSLVLAGHSINGSINVPGIKQLLLPIGAKEYYKSYSKINETDVYVSNGIGVNQVNFRLFNTPSFNFYRLKKSN